tara:strand:+ start:211 stop:615 length:405 start_codon:yes stop_codon:yes gene_type:complete
MTDSIGVLGEATNLTVATHTVYTCPTAKAAKVKLQVQFEGHAANSTGDITLTVNGVVVAERLNIPATEIMWSNSTTLIHDPSTSVKPDGSTAVLTCSPAPQEFYLSAGDIVSYTVGTDALVAMNMQVVGTEIDV